MTQSEYIRGGSIHRVTAGSPINTGTWRVFRPVLNQALCNSCKLCFWFCPDSTVIFEKDNVQIDYEHCKGCGLCAHECPKKAITMKREEERS
jgi:pyruvate ferredoxin oxidoreductase delta subunit